MCTSRLHKVVEIIDDDTVLVVDMDGTSFVSSLLALDGPKPVVGAWLVVHSGYAIDRVDGAEAESVAAQIRRATSMREMEV